MKLRQVGLSEAILASSVSALDATTLGHLFDFAAEIGQAHWSVMGRNIIVIHKFFDEMRRRVDELIDILTDRVARIATSAREEIYQSDGSRDLVTSDIFTEVARALDRELWFLEVRLVKS